MKKTFFNSLFVGILLSIFLLISYMPFSTTVLAESTENKIVNGNFDDGDDGWYMSKEATTSNGYIALNKQGAYLQTNKSSSNNATFNLSRDSFYQLTLNVWKLGNGDAKISIWIGENDTSYDFSSNEIEISQTAKENALLKFIFNKTSGNTSGLWMKITSTTQTCEQICIDDISLNLIDNIITTETGASIRNSSTDSGIRFKGNINKGVYDYLAATYGKANVKTGMLLAPTNIIDVEDFTIEKLEDNKVTYINKVIEKWNNSSTADTDGYYGFNCVIANIKSENLDRKFSARAYISYIDNNEETTYIYADYNEENHSRSIYEVANKALESDELDENSKVVADEYKNRIQIENGITDFEQDGTNKYDQKFSRTYCGSGVLYINFTLSNDYNTDRVTSVNVYINGEIKMPVNDFYYGLDDNINEVEVKITIKALTNIRKSILNGSLIKFYSD